MSVTSEGEPAPWDSRHQVVSADGEYVAYISVCYPYPPDPNAPCQSSEVVDVWDEQQLFLFEVASREVRELAKDVCARPSISDDGRYVAFGRNETSSSAEDFDRCEIYVYDRVLDSLDHVASDRHASPIAMSGDGSYVAYSAEDFSDETTEIIVVERRSGDTEKFDVAIEMFDAPWLSRDGRYLAFLTADSLSPDDQNGLTDLYLIDRATGVVERPSAGVTDRSFSSQHPHRSWTVYDFAFSPNMRFVALSTDLYSEYYDGVLFRWGIVLHDRSTGSTTEFSFTSRDWDAYTFPESAPALAGGEAFYVSNHGDRLYLRLGGAVPVTIPGWMTHAYALDRSRLPSTTLEIEDLDMMDVNLAGEPADQHLYSGASSDDGSLVVLASEADNLIPGVTDSHGVDDMPTDLFITRESAFADTAGSVFDGDIAWLAAEGITRGCNPPANDRFCPDDFVTRGQMAAFLHRALGDVLEPSESGGFVDVAGSTFVSDIEWLGATGVTKGCNPPANDRFCPNDFVTRGQMAAFLVRALGYTDNGGGDLFVDDDGSTFENDIDKLGTAGVTRGCNPPVNDRFCPDDFVTRGQMAAFLHRALG